MNEYFSYMFPHFATNAFSNIFWEIKKVLISVMPWIYVIQTKNTFSFI